MKVTNQYIYSDDKDYLRQLEEEFALLGRRTKLEDDRLVVFARGRKSNKKNPPKKRR